MQIAIGLYPGLTLLDAVGPYQVLSQVPGNELIVCAERTGRLTDDNDLIHLDIEHTFADVPRPDLLLVPGGFVVTGTLDAPATAGDVVVVTLTDTGVGTTSSTSLALGVGDTSWSVAFINVAPGSLADGTIAVSGASFRCKGER